MKVSYDKEADAAYIILSSKKPDGAVEMAEGAYSGVIGHPFRFKPATHRSEATPVF